MKLTDDFSKQAIDAAIKIAAIAMLVYWCFSILRPFILLVVWGAIIATALYPVAVAISNKTGMSKGKASALLSFIGVILLLIPLVALSSGIYTSTSDLMTGLQDGTLSLPKPKESLQEIPFIGERVYSTLVAASNNIEGTFIKYADELKIFASKAASVLGSLGGGFIQFIISTIIAGAFMSNAERCQTGVTHLVARLTDGKGKGKELVQLSKATVRSVVQGVIGVAVIQSIMSAIGLVIAGVPAAAMWALAVLLIAIIQLPPILALLPAIIYMFSVESTLAASLFLVWCILVSGSDAILKPMLLSRGSHIPMLVILLGALGGMAMSGIVGLFVGAVILSLTYELMMAWLGLEDKGEEDQEAK
ncbi:AI-2E family transporter [Vibrio cyclitrophicus]|uniref:AI-2E family transporter n=1 Tax=Vibrio cyclitrophicus TaxID=47951 RepID=UPI000C85AA19|nr:AI-2E family transporter [Vibrio cyclitrophicus]PMI07753.1 AI-2E family transporter [Vibrio cyclitrophicus]